MAEQDQDKEKRQKVLGAARVFLQSEPYNKNLGSLMETRYKILENWNLNRSDYDQVQQTAIGMWVEKNFAKTQSR